VPEGQVVEVGRGDLVGRDDDVIGVGLARDGDRTMDHPDPPGRAALGAGIDVAQRAVWRPLLREDPADDDRVAGGQDDLRPIRREDRHEVVIGPLAGERRQIVGPVDRCPIVDVVGARDDDGPDPGRRQSTELGADALDRSPGLGVRVEEVAGDQDDIDLLRDRQIDRRLEGRELALALGRGLVTEIGVARPQVHVGRVEELEHPVAAGLPRRSLPERSSGTPAGVRRALPPSSRTLGQARRAASGGVAAATLGVLARARSPHLPSLAAPKCRASL
jgi:hypothetical protein